MTILLAIAVLVGGPTLAFLLITVGCDGPRPIFGVLCGHNIIITLVAATLGAWLVLGTAAVAFNIWRNQE